MGDRPADNELTALSPSEVWDRVDPLASDIDAKPGVEGLGELPYAKLRGRGFERLCYELLVADGHTPRFHRRGRLKEYGVDIISETGDSRTVYQCKNRADSAKLYRVREAVAKFESGWLGEAEFSPPKSFVYCCSQPLKDDRLGESWTTYKDEFKARTGVGIYFWDKDYLDSRLRRLPDIVAGLFSDSYAQHFCNSDHWLDDPWIRVRWGESRYRALALFLERHRQGTIHVPDRDEECFEEKLLNSSVLAIRGLPGSGKTVTGLELACRLRGPLRRIYYATFKDSLDSDRLWRSVRRRCSLPAVFFLDDCHLNSDGTDVVLERLQTELRDPTGIVKLVVVLRDLPGSTSGEVVDKPDWLVHLEQVGSVMDMKTDLERTRGVTLHLRSDLTGLSARRLERLHRVTGGDLVQVEEILNAVESPRDLDGIEPSHCYKSLRQRYFGRPYRLPTVQRLACLAQFDLTPVASFLDDSWQAGEKDQVASLMTEVFAPPRYQFLHASLAELVLRALLALEVEAGSVEDAVVDSTATELTAYLRHLTQDVDGTSGTARDSELMRSLEILLGVRLNLAPDIAQAQVKAEVLKEQFVMQGIEEHLQGCSFMFLHRCLRVLATVSHAAKQRYATFVERRFHMLFENAHDKGDRAGMATAGTGFMTLARHAPTSLVAVEDTFGSERFVGLIAANGTLPDLFGILQYSTRTFREELLGQLDDDVATKLVDNAIAAGRSIGTLHLALRELRDGDEELLEGLEQTIGAKRYLRLIEARGTLVNLFRILEYSTPTFREELLGQLEDAVATELVENTIAAERSIGTLHLALRELRDGDEELLKGLEQTIGAERYLRLIEANGTLVDLFRILEYSTPTFREELLEQLDDAVATELVDQTIAAGRSIGTLDLALRELRDGDEELLERLEQTIGAKRYLRLIEANGTLVELLDVIRHSTPAFREALVGEIDDAVATELIDNTIAAGRSIESVHRCLKLRRRRLHQKERPEKVKGLLEEPLGIENWWRLLIGVGTLNSLTEITHAMSVAFRTTMVEASSDLGIADWRGVISRGLFQNACAFVRNELADYPEPSRSRFKEALRQTAAPLAAKATWSDLNPSRLAADPHSPDEQILVTALRSRIEEFRPGDLLHLDFREAINGLAFGWRERPDLREELASLLWKILPEPDDWPQEKGEVASLRLVLVIVSSELVPAEDALRLLESIRGFLTPSTCAEIYTRNLFLLLWNMCAVHYERGVGGISSFEGALPDTLIETVLDELWKRVDMKGPNEEKLAQLALAGLLRFLVPGLNTELRSLLAPLTHVTKWLYPEAPKLTFLPALFSLIGIDLLKTPEPIFTPFVRANLIEKSNEYGHIRPSAEFLRRQLEQCDDLW